MPNLRSDPVKKTLTVIVVTKFLTPRDVLVCHLTNREQSMLTGRGYGCFNEIEVGTASFTVRRSNVWMLHELRSQYHDIPDPSCISPDRTLGVRAHGRTNHPGHCSR